MPTWRSISSSCGDGARAAAVLEKIPERAPLVSHYVKRGVSGVAAYQDGAYEQALDHLRAADAYAGKSGNRFLEAVFVPLHAAAAAQVDLAALAPETRNLLDRGGRQARFSQDRNYLIMLAGAQAVVAELEGRAGRALRLRRRCQHLVGERPRGVATLLRLDASAAQR